MKKNQNKEVKKAVTRCKSALKRGAKKALIDAGLFLFGLSPDGNIKLVNTDKVRFLIWNIPAVKTCPFATPHCIEKCYALKAETAYPGCLPFRERNLETSKRDDFVERMTATIKYYALREPGKDIIVRIHESGDFYDMEYTRKWHEITCNCAELKNVSFIAYTKSVPFTTCFKWCENVCIRASIWDDTKTELRLLSVANYPIYTAYDASEIESRKKNGEVFHTCRCSDCATCRCCFTNKVKSIYCVIH